MIEFLWPWLGLLLFIPLLVWLLPARKLADQSVLQLPDISFFTGAEAGQSTADKPPMIYWLAVFLWLLLVIAAMRPQWLGEPVDLPLSGRDLMLGIDISGSMREEDFVINNQRVSRLQMVKVLGQQFISQRSGDRIGLILFGERAYVQTPLTFDRRTVMHFLNEAVVGLAGRTTAIGDAIGLAIKRLRDRPQESRVLVLLTDGTNTAGTVQPIEAAQFAAKLGIKIYTIGVGGDARQGIGGGFFSTPMGGSPELDEKTLRSIAKITDGLYFRARNTSEMAEIYQQIDLLETNDDQQQSMRPMYELFIWPLGASLLMALCWGIVATVVKRND